MGASASKKQIKVLEQPNAHYDKCFAELPSMEVRNPERGEEASGVHWGATAHSFLTSHHKPAG